MENLQITQRVRPEASASANVAATDRPRQTMAQAQKDDPLIFILSTGLMAEVVLPWIAVWLSDVFFLDVPAWSLWVLFGAPPALGILALLAIRAIRAFARHSAQLGNWRVRTGATLCCQ